ncbi:Jag family protein [Trueperella bialowiezensis]|uniref:R3H domain n=1 Tax=Trueperella bialowiezensis TaxID=312285 RepID=A0A3S4X5W6_9ACTO|nr:R3H domain-containing nucleic acid-binding protein [Trueperella bialowiezensis]VEI13343.1 R3H domain [Trueperella bialowiezensis]
MTEENVEKLDREGDIAADYLEELLDIADLDGDLEIGIEADRASVGIVADDGGDRRLKRLIGRRGETLESLQELTRLVVQQETGERSRMMLDILGYRENQRENIAEIARRAIERVKKTGEEYAMKPMNPFERKVVHDVVADAGLFSDSSGTGNARHVVIYLEEPVSDDFDDDYDDQEDDE